MTTLNMVEMEVQDMKWSLRKKMTEVHDIAREEGTRKLSKMMKKKRASIVMLITLKIKITGEETHMIGRDDMNEVRSAEKMRGMYGVKEVPTGKMQKITQEKMARVMEERWMSRSKGTLEMRENTVEDMRVMLVIDIGGMIRSMIRTMGMMQTTGTSGMREIMKRGWWMMLVIETENMKMRLKRKVAMKIFEGVVGIGMILEMIIMVINEGAKNDTLIREVLKVMMFVIAVEGIEFTK